MSHRMFSRPRVSMESLVEEPAVAEEDVIEIATRPDPEAMAAQAEVNDAAGEVMSRDSDVAELADATDNLETYRAVLEESLEENGMDRAGAMAVQVGLDSTLSRVGTRINTPAMESYGTASNRIQATRLTIEAIGEKIKEIWEAIKAALMKAWEAVKKFFAAIFDSVERVRQQAEKVKAAGASASGTPSANEVEAKGAGGKLQVNGSVPDNWLDGVASGLGGVGQALQGAEMAGEFYGSIASKINVSNIADGQQAAADAVTAYMTAVKTGAEIFREFGGKQAAPGLKIPGVDQAKVDLTVTGLLPGNVVFYVAVPKKADVTNLQEAVGLARAGFFALPTRNEAPDTFKTMASGDITKLADAVISMCGELDKAKASLAKSADGGKALIQAGDSLLNRMANEPEETQAQARSVVQALPRINENVTAWPKPMVSWYLSIASASLKVAQASLGAYKNSYQGTGNQLDAPKPAAAGTPALAAPAA